MDLVASCKEKLAHFRIKELKDILAQLGLSKQGRKQDLADRILAIISDDRGIWARNYIASKEEVAKIVDDVHRKLQAPGASDLASKTQNISHVTINTNFKAEVEDTFQREKVRCLCASSLQTESMIKCEHIKCNTLQHIACVVIPEKPMEGIQATPPTTFYCELCRLARADPFWVTMGHPLYPSKLTIASVPADGTSPMQRVEKTFQLTKADRDLLAKPEFELQAWCMLLNDKVSFRMQWPQYADLQVNGMPMRAINRPGSQLLGANGRDDGPIITPCIREGNNKVSLTGCDARVFCFGVRIVRRRTVQQILNLIPKESDGERFEDAVARVCRCVGGGPATDNADSDSDLEVVADSISVNLRCPMSGSRMKIAGRFKPCAHMGCFDLEVFVQMNQRSRKWQCPICLKNYSLEDIIIDPYFSRITTKMQNCEEDVTEIEVKPDGSWRVKAESDQKSLGQLGQWHLADGTLFVPMEVESKLKPKPETSKQVKQEVGSEVYNTGLKLGIKKNSDGIWEVCKPDNKLPEKAVNNGQNGNNGFPICSSATFSGRDGEDPSINEDGGGHFGHCTTNAADFGPLSPTMDLGYGFTNLNPPDGVHVDADVVVLSDSEDETENPMTSAPTYNNNNNNDTFSVLPQAEDSTPFVGGSSSLGLFNNNNDDDFGVPFWSLPSTSQMGPSFQLFGSDDNNNNNNNNNGLGGSTSMDGFTFPDEIGLDSAPGSSFYQSNYINNELVDNPLAFEHDDPSLQLFLPTRPPEAAEQVKSKDQSTMPEGLTNDDWISLRLGGGEPDVMNGLNSSQQPLSQNGTMDAVTDTDSLVLGMKPGKTRSDDPFSCPGQKRSVRPRLFLSLDTDSEEDR